MTAAHQVIGDGMARKARRVNQGDLLMRETVFMDDGVPEEPDEQESERS